jgi:prepilin-type N-terminal cleavage/methylation domain-containing protein
MTFLRRIRRTDDRGMTLVELLVSMGVFTVLGLAVMATTITTMRTTRNTSARNDDLNKVQVAMDAMTKYIRTAAQPPVPSGVAASTAMISAGPTDIQFYGYDKPGAAPSLIRYYVDGTNRLIEERTPTSQCTAPYTWAAANKQTRVLATNLSTGQTIFVYHTVPVSAPVPMPTGSPLPTSGSPAVVAAADLVNIDSVAITLSVDVPTSPDIPSTRASSTVALQNHDANNTLLPGAAC